MTMLTKDDARLAGIAIESGKATGDEVRFLDEMISMYESQLHVGAHDRNRLYGLIGVGIGVYPPIGERLPLEEKFLIYPAGGDCDEDEGMTKEELLHMLADELGYKLEKIDG